MTAMKTLSIHIYHKVISMISLNIYQISLDKVDVELYCLSKSYKDPHFREPWLVARVWARWRRRRRRRSSCWHPCHQHHHPLSERQPCAWWVHLLYPPRVLTFAPDPIHPRERSGLQTTILESFLDIEINLVWVQGKGPHTTLYNSGSVCVIILWFRLFFLTMKGVDGWRGKCVRTLGWKCHWRVTIEVFGGFHPSGGE